MLRATKRIIVISERVNRYGFRALIDGIDLAQYEANPIMLWMHNRAFGRKDECFLPLGNVIELRKEVIDGVGLCITGQPMFDDTDDFAKSIFKKYENGTLRMASAGLIPVEWSEDEDLLLIGQRAATLVKSILEEISMVDIGADSNALSIALYNHNHERIELSSEGANATIPLITHHQIKNEMLKIELTAAKAAVLLGLKDVGSTDEFEIKVAEVVQLAHSQKTQIETLTRENGELQTKLTAAENAGLDEAKTVMLAKAVEDRKITQDEVAFYSDQITDKASFEKVKLHLDNKAGATTAQAAIKLNAGKTADAFGGKTWDELDRSGQLVQLKAQNLTLFKDLYKSKFNKEYAG